MLKIHRFFALVLSAFIMLCLLTGVMTFYNIQSNRVQRLALESMTLLAQWNDLQNETYQILLYRYTVEGTEIPERIEEWQKNYASFSEDLYIFAQNEQLGRLSSIHRKIDGILRLWRYTEVQLNNADHYFSRIIQNGLGEKVMVNGFLHTMYKLRMAGQLKVSEIFLLDDTIYALASLDNASREFDALFSSVVEELEDAGEHYLNRMRYISIALSFSIIIFFFLLYLVQRQLKRSQINRKIYLMNQKTQLLKMILENSCEENLELFDKRRQELSVDLSLEKTIMISALQIDDYSGFSHRLNIREQENCFTSIERTMGEMLHSRGIHFEFCRYSHDFIIIILNVDEKENYENLKEWFTGCHSNLLKQSDVSLSMTCGSFSTDKLDLDRDFAALLGIAEYRFLSGKGSFLYSGSSCLQSFNDFHYPIEKEKLFEDAMKSLNEKEALRILGDLINVGLPYGPRNMRRLIIRFTATLSTLVEYMERTYHIHSIEHVTPMILRVQSPETIEEVKLLLTEIATKVINECLKKKEERHDHTVIQVKEIIEKELHDFNLSADAIADRFQLTSSYLNRLFKQHTTLSIAGYINECRLNHAEFLLRTSEDSVGDIAENSGFSSMGTFFRLYKKKYGRTPGDYQREARALNNGEAEE